MPPKLTAQERFKLIERVVDDKEKVAVVCREAGISRVLFYRWLARYKKLEKPLKLSPQKRLEMIRRVKGGEAVVKACQEFGVSRTVFYRWLKRYEAADEEEKLEALQDKKPKIERYFRQTPEKYEEVVLNLVVEHPELSTHKLVEFLPQIAGRPIIGNHGIQNVLRRHNLTTFERRLTYSQALRHPPVLDRAIHVFQNLLYAFYDLPVGVRPRLAGFVLALSLGIFLGIIILGGRELWQTLQIAPLGNQIGLFFALIALGSGTLFFLYSLKYYFLLTLVLGFSRQVSGGGQIGSEDNGNEVLNGKGSIWQRIFGVRIGSPSTSPGSNGLLGENGNGPSGGGNLRGGLQPDLPQVKLERTPFVSIHLPMYNEKRVVDRLLSAVTSQDYENYEVIVADDSTDETTSIVQDFAEKWNGKSSSGGLTSSRSPTEVRPPRGPVVKVIHRETREGFKGGALRRALEASHPATEFVLVFDADFLPYPDTITQFLKYFQVTAGGLDFRNQGGNQGGLTSVGDLEEVRPLKEISLGGPTSLNTMPLRGPTSSKPSDSPIAAVQGYQWHVLNKSENWVTRGVRSEYAGSYVVERSGEEALGALKQIAGSVYIIRKDILDRYGWGTSITEDFELTLKLYRDGYKVVYTPYIQTPSECVSTLKRLIRQRMRWAEGHSHNIKRMFTSLMWGRWESSDSFERTVPAVSFPQGQSSLGKGGKEKLFIPSKLTWMEKLEFLYLSPYYLQATLFLIGTLAWFLSEGVFRTRLPFWTSLWGWSLVFTNLFSLPLMNTVGLFLEESEERDYMGILSFLSLSYILAPFQGYAAVKGFIEKQEGPWFRTPKTGRITDIFTPGRFARFISGIFGKPAPAVAGMRMQANGERIQANERMAWNISPRISAFSNFQSFKIRRRQVRWVGNMSLVAILITVTLLTTLAPLIPQNKLAAQAQERQFAKLTNSVIEKGKDVKVEEEEDSEITQPKLLRYKTEDNKSLDYIFHPEPRVRTKYESKEIELELTESEGLGQALPKKSVKQNGSYIYQDIFPDVDLRLFTNKDQMREEIILKKYQDFTSINYNLKTIDLEIVQYENEIYFFGEDKTKWLFYLAIPFMFEEKNPEANNYGLSYELSQTASGWSLKKVLTEEGKVWLSDSARSYPVILDPTLYNNVIQGLITETEARYGSNQRKLVYSSTAAAWYTVYDDGADVFFEKCAASTCQSNGWTNATDLDTSDADNRHPDAWIEGANIWVAWIDNGEDGIEFRPINTASSDALGTQCVGPDTGTLSPATYSVSIAVADDGDVFTAFADTSTDTELGVYRVASASLSNCGTPTTNGTNWDTITGNSGLTAGDRPVLVTTGNNLHMIFQDGQLSHSAHDGTNTTTWSTANSTIVTDSDTDYSVATDGIDVWVLQATGATGANLWKCSSCPISSPTWTDAADPWSGQSNVSYVAITYISNVNKIIAFEMRGTAGSDEQVYALTSDADSISWVDAQTLGFTSNSLDHLSSLMIAPTENEVAVVAQDAAASELEFSTVPENLWILLALAPILPGLFKKLRGRRVLCKTV